MAKMTPSIEDLLNTFLSRIKESDAAIKDIAESYVAGRTITDQEPQKVLPLIGKCALGLPAEVSERPREGLLLLVQIIVKKNDIRRGIPKQLLPLDNWFEWAKNYNVAQAA